MNEMKHQRNRVKIKLEEEVQRKPPNSCLSKIRFTTSQEEKKKKKKNEA